MRDAVDDFFRNLPVWNNYFWSVYLQGNYTEHCCPEYLKRDKFAALKAGFVDSIELHTQTVAAFMGRILKARRQLLRQKQRLIERL